MWLHSSGPRKSVVDFDGGGRGAGEPPDAHRHRIRRSHPHRFSAAFIVLTPVLWWPRGGPSPGGTDSTPPWMPRCPRRRPRRPPECPGPGASLPPARSSPPLRSTSSTRPAPTGGAGGDTRRRHRRRPRRGHRRVRALSEPERSERSAFHRVLRGGPLPADPRQDEAIRQLAAEHRAQRGGLRWAPWFTFTLGAYFVVGGVLIERPRSIVIGTVALLLVIAMRPMRRRRLDADLEARTASARPRPMG